jgi:hypothetical protein
LAKSPTQLSLEKLKEEGYTAQVVERWNAFARVRVDLFGFIDIIGLKDGETLAVQATSYTNISARVKKITEHENLAEVRKAGWRLEVWGWRKVNNRWTVKIVDIS